MNNRFLRALAMIAPAAALRRSAALDLLSARGYDAAQRGRRTASFRAGPQSANGVVGAALPVLRARSRELVQNSFIGPRTLDVMTSHIVGTDLSVRFNTGSERLDQQAQSLWNRWADQCDIEGETNFTGILDLALRGAFEGGDAIIRMKPRRLSDDRVVPFALHVGEGDLIDESRDPGQLTGGQTRSRLGVELGPDDERLGYWLHQSPPGEPMRPGRDMQSRLVPRQDVCHLFRRIRPGQVRGVPIFAPILLTARDYADLMDAVVVTVGMEANLGLVVRTQDPAANLGRVMAQGSDKTLPIEELSPGMVHYLRPGEDVTAFQPSARTSLDPIATRTLMAIAAGSGITYDQLTGDLSNANYSSLRAGKIEFRRLVASLQWHMLVPQAVDRIVSRFVHYAILAGKLPARRMGYDRTYVMPAIEPIDPKKDLEADILAVRAGRMSPQDFIEAWGRDWRQVLDEYEEFLKVSDAAGLVFDIDARQRTRVGGDVQPAAPANHD